MKFDIASKRFRKNYVHHFTSTKTLFLFPPSSSLRKICICIITNEYFDYCVMTTILINCVFLAMTETFVKIEYCFLAIYTFEMVIKIIAKGFVLNKYTYLRDPWNWLDFVVIASGYATIGMDVGNLSGLRTFSVLRVLKTVSIMPDLKTIINAFLHSFKQLAEVMTLTIFCLMVFSLFALQAFMGELRNKCVKNLPQNWTTLITDNYSSWIGNTDNWLYDEDVPVLCGNLTGARQCPEGYICLCVGENPNYGYTNFDNIMWSMLTTFQLMTLDFWENVYDMILATCGPITIPFFCVVVFFGSCYLINLMLAAVALSYRVEAEIINKERKNYLQDQYGNPKLVCSLSKDNSNTYENSDGDKYQSSNSNNPTDDKSAGFCCHESWLRFQNCLYEVVKDPFFEMAIIFCIVLNTVFLAVEHHGMKESLRQILDVGNKIFTSIFTIECCVKLLALSKDFFLCRWNIFDFIIVLASLCDIIFESVNGLSCLRPLRLLRIFKLAESWTTMKVLLNIIISTISALGNLTIILLIVIYMFAIIGMQLFSKDYTPEKFIPDPVPRWNFNDFFHSFMMIFRILCGEWVEPLWDCMRAEEQKNNYISCFTIFFPTLVIGNYMVLNLFLALLLNNFNSEELKSKKEARNIVEEVRKESTFSNSIARVRLMISRKRKENIKNKCNTKFKKAGKNIQARNLKIHQLWYQKPKNEFVSGSNFELKIPLKNVTLLKKVPKNIQIPNVGIEIDDSSRKKLNMNNILLRRTNSFENILKEKQQLFILKNQNLIPSFVSTMKLFSSGQKNQQLFIDSNDSIKVNIKSTSIQQLQIDDTPNSKNTLKKCNEKHNSMLISHIDDIIRGEGRYFENDLSQKPKKVSKVPQKLCPCFLSYTNKKFGKHWEKLRANVREFVSTSAFEYFIIILIFASSITLCFEDVYLDQNESLKKILYWINIIFCLIFVIEMVLMWLALGFTKYFTGFWTILDFLIVFISVFSVLIEENENLKVFKSFRTLRALRPLRVMSKWKGMRIVLNALIFAIPSIFNVLLVCMLFWLIFSIMGVQFFGGKFFKCVDESGEKLPTETINDKWQCIENNYTWINSKVTFDNVGMGYLALFQVATFEGWMEVMEDAVDVRGINLQPQREANIYAYIYFVIFIVCGSFFTLNLFIGVIIDHFNMLKRKYEDGSLEMFLTESQKHYYSIMKKLGRRKPRKMVKRPLNRFLAIFYDLSNSKRFEIAIFVFIFLNMLTMAIEHYNQSYRIFFILKICNQFFTTVFALEAVIKIIGLRHYYFTVPWNIFDFLLVCTSIFTLIMEDLIVGLPISPILLRVARVFRIGRILRLIKGAKGIRKLLFALIISLPALFDIGALLALITFIYAILGMSLFGHVKLQGALDDVVNFQTFGRSMQLLFRLMTSAGWNDILDSLMIQPPDCDPNFNAYTNGDCGHLLLSIIYFTSFILISYIIVINMYIAIILGNFNQAHQDENIVIVEDDLKMFYKYWSKYDPRATQFIYFSQLSDFIASLDPPLGIQKPNTIALASFNLPILKGDKIHCIDILHALVRHVIGYVEETENFKILKQQIDAKFKKEFPTREKLEIISTTKIWKRQDKAVRTIQQAWKEYQRRKKGNEVSVASGINKISSHGKWNAQLLALKFLNALRINKKTSVSDISPEAHGSTLKNSTLIHVLVHTDTNVGEDTKLQG